MGQLTGGKTRNSLETQTGVQMARNLYIFGFKKRGREQVSVNAFSYNNNDDNQFHVSASLLRKASSVLHLGAKFFPVQSQTNISTWTATVHYGWINPSIHLLNPLPPALRVAEVRWSQSQLPLS